MNNEKLKIDVDKLYLQTYNRIANWHNEDATSEGLKLVTNLIIDSFFDTLSHSLNTNCEVKLDISDDVQKSIDEIKKNDATFLT